MDTAVHTFEPTPEPAPRPSVNAPQLRTLLLTDLVDSTGVIERLGDTPASELFRAHDRLVLQLQQQWRGRLIDRSDGLLLLFERPIDGLGFALDYTRGLLTLGKDHNLELRARAGLHVGEVLTWRNSAEAVSVGAKPLEVEGLAKPMAARLMAMARPGQILLSAVAEPLAHRAARELGERGQLLLWKSWGRWRFKGVPDVQEIFEVGEPDLAPLRTPPSTPKAWRDIPLWRRPAALAAELALLAGGVLGVWLLTRPEPAIAFSQRDWVVVGDLRNLTGQSALDDTLEQAFRISLEQSRYVNVLSDLKARDTLQRMQRPTDTVLDRAVASEIALRDGARAVILPTVAEVGGRVRVSAEVIDPHTQTTVYAESAEGKGIDSTLDSIDGVTAALRGKLGEAVKSIEKDSVPLPKVATSNLDALRAYAMGQKALDGQHYQEATAFYQRAIKLDPMFALAHIGLLRVYNSQSDLSAGVTHLRRAQALQDKLPPRDQLYLEAWGARVDEPAREPDKWQQMASLYPDDFPAHMNVAFTLFGMNRFKEGLPSAVRAASPQNVSQAQAQRLLGDYFLAQQDFAKAERAHLAAMSGGVKTAAVRHADAFGAQMRFAEADKAWSQIHIERDNGVLLDRVALLLDEGKWDAASAEAVSLSKYPEAGSIRARAALLPVATAQWMRGRTSSATQTLATLIGAALTAIESPRTHSDAQDDACTAIFAALLAQRMGERALADTVIEQLGRRQELLASPNAELMTVLRANARLIAGDAPAAVASLEPLASLDNAPYQAHVALFDAYLTAGNGDEAKERCDG